MIKIESKTTIQALFEQHPQAAAAFIKLRMLCVGCPVQAFHTLEDVARVHGCTVQDLCNAVRNAIQTK